MFEDNWFDVEDVKDIPDVLSPIEYLQEQINELTELIRKSELQLHSDLMRAAVAA
jgi:hypothetical protein